MDIFTIQKQILNDVFSLQCLANDDKIFIDSIFKEHNLKHAFIRNHLINLSKTHSILTPNEIEMLNSGEYIEIGKEYLVADRFNLRFLFAKNFQYWLTEFDKVIKIDKILQNSVGLSRIPKERANRIIINVLMYFLDHYYKIDKCNLHKILVNSMEIEDFNQLKSSPNNNLSRP